MTIETRPENSSHRTLTPKRAVLLGHLVVSLPVFVMMILGVSIGYLLAGEEWAVVGLPIGFIGAWLWWSMSIPRWREWAKLRGADEDRTQLLAERTLLVWPKGFVLAEFWLAPRTKFGLMFVMHQVIVLWVIIVSAGILTASALNFMHLFGWQHVSSAYHWILNGTPYFPAHVALGLALGWLLARTLRDRTMLWVWVLPSVLMGYALAAIPTLTPRFVLSGFQAGIGQSPWIHYFGRGCQLGNYCLDQNSFTRPFYASLAYSLGALIALKYFAGTHRAPRTQYWLLLIAGMLFLLAAIYDAVQSVRVGWHWQYLPLEGTPAAMGLYLILLAYSTRDKPAGNPTEIPLPD